MIFKLFTYT